MKQTYSYALRSSMASILLLSAASAGAANFHVSTFATGTAVHATAPDSIALTKNSVWVSYTNGADSTGLGGNSTVVRYTLNGQVRKQYSFAGSVDGLKVDPASGLVWVLQNQDGNSTLTFIDTEENIVSQAIPYAITSTTRGIDDVAFKAGKAFVSYTNPTGPTDATIELVQEDSSPVVVKPILLEGAKGTNLATGQSNQLTTQTDPDSLKITPDGDLMMSSGSDGQLIFVEGPGTAKQSVSFLQLLDQAQKPVSGLDDAVFATSHRGTFFLADTTNNRILKIVADDLHVGSLFASVGSLNAFVSVNQKTGVVTPITAVAGLQGPHGIEFMPHQVDEDECSNEDAGK
jgi:hypothetical protein